MKYARRTVAIVLLFIVLVSAVPFRAAALSGVKTTHIGIVKASKLNLRSEPSSNSKIITQAPKADYVVITGKVGEWYRVNYNLVSGYMHQAYLNVYTVKNIELGYGRITGNKVNLRSGPGTTYSVASQANTNDTAYIIGLNNQWYKVICKGLVCYVRSDYLELTEIPYENQASTKQPKFFVNGKSTGVVPSANALTGSSTDTLANQIIANAKKHLGTPYVWGGDGPGGFDCSGFTQYILAQSGIKLPRNTADQYKIGTYVSKTNLRPGDLVFLANTYRSGISHVGIYIGDGNFIHASSSKGVTISSLSGSYYQQHYYGSKRIL